MLHAKIIAEAAKQSIFWNVSVLSKSASTLIANLKNKYYSKVAKKLLDPSTSPKMYCQY